MLRVALLTADPALWSGVSAIVHERRSWIIDLRMLRRASPRTWSKVKCDAVVLDARMGEGEAVWHPLRARWDVPTIALIEHGQASLLPTFLGQSPRHELAMLSGGLPAVLQNVRSFLARQEVSAKWVPRWGSYRFDPESNSVDVAELGTLRLSPHKFRFVLSLFLHRDVEIAWADLHRLAWHTEGGMRAAAVAAHAAWALEVLELDGRHGYVLQATGTRYQLRAVAAAARPAPEPPGERDTGRRDFADSTPGGL